MSKHRIEVEVTVDDETLEEKRDTGAFRGRPDAWINLGDIEWAIDIGAVSSDSPIIDYSEVQS